VEGGKPYACKNAWKGGIQIIIERKVVPDRGEVEKGCIPGTKKYQLEHVTPEKKLHGKVRICTLKLVSTQLGSNRKLAESS